MISENKGINVREKSIVDCKFSTSALFSYGRTATGNYFGQCQRLVIAGALLKDAV